jgi:hypothetical protein
MDRQVHQEQEAARFRRPQRRAARCFGRRGAGKGPEYIAVRGGAWPPAAAWPGRLNPLDLTFDNQWSQKTTRASMLGCARPSSTFDLARRWSTLPALGRNEKSRPVACRAARDLAHRPQENGIGAFCWEHPLT